MVQRGEDRAWQGGPITAVLSGGRWDHYFLAGVGPSQSELEGVATPDQIPRGMQMTPEPGKVGG